MVLHTSKFSSSFVHFLKCPCVRQKCPCVRQKWICPYVRQKWICPYVRQKWICPYVQQSLFAYLIKSEKDFILSNKGVLRNLWCISWITTFKYINYQFIMHLVLQNYSLIRKFVKKTCVIKKSFSYIYQTQSFSLSKTQNFSKPEILKN